MDSEWSDRAKENIHSIRSFAQISIFRDDARCKAQIKRTPGRSIRQAK